MGKNKIIITLIVLLCINLGVMAVGKHTWKETLKNHSQQSYTRNPEDTKEHTINEEEVNEEEINEEEVELTLAEQLGIEPKEAIMRTKNVLRVRKDATVQSEVIGRFSENASVIVIGELSNGWYQVDYNGETGYVDGDYLTSP